MAVAVEARGSSTEELTSAYIRQPSVVGDRIVFIAEDDIWEVGTGGGQARRLTSGLAPSHPLFSKDGKQIAFTICSDVWIMSKDDCAYRQLTWFGWGEAKAVAWTDATAGKDGIIVSSTFADPHCRPSLFLVSVSGDETQPLFDGVELDCIINNVGANGNGVILGRHTTDSVSSYRWKGYRGGKYGRLWLDSDGAGNFDSIEVLDTAGPSGTHVSIACPMWIADRVWFLADTDGSGNLWSMTLGGADLRQHSSHELFDARSARSDGKSVVYVHAGELWLLADAANETSSPRQVEVNIGFSNARIPRFLSASDWCDGIALHPEAHHCAVICRGQVFEMALWEGPAVRLQVPRTTSPDLGKAVRCLAFDYLFSGRLLTITDEHAPLLSLVIHPYPCQPDSETPVRARDILTLFIADAGMPAQQMTSPVSIGQVEEMMPSPAHDAVVVTTARNELVLVEFVTEDGERHNPQTQPCAKIDVALKVETRVLDKSEWEDGISEPCWSPDGEWICYARKDAYYGSSLVLISIETGEKSVIADSSFVNARPCFHPDGSYLSFFSARCFAPTEDDITMDLGFSLGAELPYLVLLQKDLGNPFRRVPLSPAEAAQAAENDGADEDDYLDEQEDGDDSDSNSPEFQFSPPEKVKIDLEGIQDRVLQFPVAPGKYGHGQWTENGKFQYLRGAGKCIQRDMCDDNDDEDSTTYTLFMYDFTTLKEKQLATKVLDFHLSWDLKNMALRVEDEDGEEQYRVHVAGQKPPQEDDDADVDLNLDAPGADSGILDIDGRISLRVVPIDEWKQIFSEVCHHVTEHFYDQDFGSVDWSGTCDKYRAILPKLRARSELTDLCCELLGELGVSHMCITAPESEDSSAMLRGSQGQLGVQVSWKEFEGGGAYHVDKLVRGDSWDPRYSGPLARPCVGVTEGSLIVACNRTRVCREVSLSQMLAHSVDTEVFLTFVSPEHIGKFEKFQALVAKTGGVDGLRHLNSSQRKALRDQNVSAKRKGKKKKGRERGKDKEKDKGHNDSAKKSVAAADNRVEADIEKRLADVLSKAGIDAADGPMWKTSRVNPVGETLHRNAALRHLVERRSKDVHEVSGGRVGYLHVPDTTELGYAEFYRYFSRECEREALVVDLRCNQGGYASELILKKLREQPIGWSVPREGRGRPTVSPALCPNNHLVLLVDENTCSDGECWANAFQSMKLGTVVGVRTWGGVVETGAADIELIDGASLSIPSVHYYVNNGTGYSLENFGVQPDIVVEWPPKAHDGSDPQLAEAVRLAMAKLASTSTKVDVPPFPRARLHRLSKRPAAVRQV
eukprot:TRINITY_DN42967_c0_g1_i1.p1 TRINITY_DN42967_c0_g1~~TRINITY_DN42967_c0_g1_i1.p1  ORF type:complete len:1324 (+),score=213.53 TRINITY_DN42967_c0_g1_i1:57-3974(+)